MPKYTQVVENEVFCGSDCGSDYPDISCTIQSIGFFLKLPVGIERFIEKAIKFCLRRLAESSQNYGYQSHTYCSQKPRS